MHKNRNVGRVDQLLLFVDKPTEFEKSPLKPAF